MFRLKIKILLSDILKSSKTQLINETETLLFPNTRVILLSSASQCIYSETRTFNGFQKSFVPSRKIPKLWNDKYLSNVSDEKCWQCNEPLKIKNFCCESCGSLQYPKQNINYFQLFGISQTFPVDPELLSEKFKNLQKIFHPDKFVKKSEKELEIAEEYSRIVNKAYEILKDPLARGFYLLELQKIPMDEKYSMGQDFLIQVIAKNEELEAVNSEGELRKFAQQNNQEISTRIANITNAFQASNWCDVKMNLMKLNYYYNLDKKIKAKESELVVFRPK